MTALAIVVAFAAGCGVGFLAGIHIYMAEVRRLDRDIRDEIQRIMQARLGKGGGA